MFNADNKNVNFLAELWLGILTNKFGAINSREVFLKMCMIFHLITMLLINLTFSALRSLSWLKMI